jgi:hypothetical protein
LVEAESGRVPIRANESVDQEMVCRVFAATSNDELYFSCGHQSARLDWRDEPFTMEITLQHGKLTTYHPFNRTAEFKSVSKGDQISPHLGRDVVFLFMPAWPLKNYPPPWFGAASLLHVTSYPKDWTLTSRRELVGGEWCTQIRSSDGSYRVWLAERKNQCVMQSERFDAARRILLHRLVTRRIAEIAPGMSMPVEVDYFTFASNGQDGQPEPTTCVRTRVTKWKLGTEVADDLFKLVLAPGTLEMDGPSSTGQISAGGTDQLDHVADFCRTMGLPQPRSTRERVKDGILWVLVGLVAGACFGIFASAFSWNWLRMVYPHHAVAIQSHDSSQSAK